MTAPKTPPLATEGLVASAGAARKLDDASAETYSFELDDDLVKVVTVWRDTDTCRVNVRYGGDYLIREENHVFPIDAAFEIKQHKHGITVRATKARFPWFWRKPVRHF